MTGCKRLKSRLGQWLGTLLLVFGLVFAGIRPASAAPTVVYPASMAAMGDSITRAFNSGVLPFFDVPENSWSTGSNGKVNSHYSRIRLMRSLTRSNVAKTGSKMSDLARQAGLVPLNTEYVTILMGANDVCTSSEAAMTDPEVFRGQFRTALQTLMTRVSTKTSTRIYVISIPNVYLLWDQLRNISGARSAWSAYKTCQSLLANPTSMLPADVARRQNVIDRNIALNDVLREACSEAAFAAVCRYDNGKGYNIQFTAQHVSTRDYFHPNVSGLALAASATWDPTIFAP